MGYLPEVVRIVAAHVGGPAGAKAIGTGFFLAVDGVNVTEEGLLLTNAHVVTNSPSVRIMTTYIEHQALPVTVVAINHDRDLALLKVEPETQQWLKRVLAKRYALDHIPALHFADSDKLRTGFDVIAVGHPLGLIDQQLTMGKYQGCVHLNNEIRGLASATINGGNSGGPLLSSTKHPGEKAVRGLHYFQPSRYRLMGINTFKLTGANVDGENGFIHSNTAARVLPTLLAPLTQRYKREKQIMSMITSKMSAAAAAAAAPVAQSMLDHLTPEKQAVVNSKMVQLEEAWVDHNLGGMANGNPRTFHSWMWRHVVVPGAAHLHSGGPELLSKVLDYAENEDWEGMKAWKDGRRWKNVRSSLMATESPEVSPMIVRILPPPAKHGHSPNHGITAHPIFTLDALIHYNCPRLANGEFAVGGGVIVSNVMPKSLYEQSGGKAGDLIYGFQNSSTSAQLGAAGTWYSEKRDLPLSLQDLCNDTAINETIALQVLRQHKGLLELKMVNREPTYGELPHIRQTYGFCDEGRFEAKQRIQVQGIVFTPLRLSHVAAFKLLNYMVPERHSEFKIVVESVSPSSPAYITDAIHAGSIVTHINDEEVASDWQSAVKQLSTPHSDTNCWVVDTDYNGQKTKFVTAVRQRTIPGK